MKKNTLITISIIIIQLSFAKDILCQSLILRPSFGGVFYNTKTDLSLPHQLDSTFNGNYSSSRIAVTIGVELKYKKGSYELTFTSQQNLMASYTNFKRAGIAQGYMTNGSISQFQLAYNRYFSDQKNRFKNISPLIGLGMGLGFNRPGSFYDSTNWNSMFYSTTYPGEYISYSQINRSLSNLSYSMVLRAGAILKLRGIERLRIIGIYNWGLNKFKQSDINYSHTTQKYFGSTTSKGRQFSVLLSIPIYLKREK